MNEKLQISGFEYISLYELKVEREINRHSHAYIRGLFSEAVSKRCMVGKDNMRTLEITWHDQEIEHIVFRGIVTSVVKTTVNNVCQLEINACSHSVLLDQVEYFRTFQDITLTYAQVIKSIQSQADFGAIIPHHSRTAIGTFLVQYRETDWEFMRRLASYAHTCLVADTMLDYTYVSFGMPKKRQVNFPKSVQYSIVKDMEQYYYWNRNQREKISESDCIYYDVVSKQWIDLCTETIFIGNRLYVYQIHSEYINGELLHSYSLRPRKSFESRKEYNPHLQGLSLKAIVQTTDQDNVQVEFDSDESTLNQKRRWFKFASVYTSPTGAGWYFMPENLERVRIHFPTSVESDAYAVSVDNRVFANEDSQNQILQTKHGQRLTFTEHDIMFENRDGSKIVMNDDKGIRLHSNHDIVINAKNAIDITAGSNINVLSNDSITLDKGNSSVTIHEQILLKGDRIKMKRL